MLAGCMVVEGPCTMTKSNIVCAEGGRVHVIRPAHTIETSGKAAKEIVQEIKENPSKADPKVLVPARARR
jgi:hypothetical protein